MQFVLQKLPALANVLNLSIDSTILIYSFLAAYGLLTVLLITYVHARFRTAAKTLKLLQAQWTSAESQHSTFVGMAQEKLGRLAVQAPSSGVAMSRTGAIAPDMRNQIAALGNRGVSLTDIARTCGLDEGEVEVILGAARLQR
jgi:hypothetical protein